MVKQTLLKTVSYAAMHMSIAVLVAYSLSGSWKIAFAIGTIEPCAQTVGYFFHERAWHKLEKRTHTQDYHDSVIDSVSPAGQPIEDLLQKEP